MNKKYPWLVIVAMLICCISVSHAQTSTSTKITINEIPTLEFPVTCPAFQLDRTWKYISGDNMEYAKPGFDDSSWKEIEVGKQTPGSKWRWYRTSFDLPANLEGKNLLLDLGKISIYDEVFLNGVQVAKFGNPPPYFVTGASDVWRKYPIAAKFFQPGRNVLAVRVYLGYKGGLHQGNYTLQALTEGAVSGRLNLKTDGANALETLLTASTNLNTFTPGGKLLISPDLMQFFGAPRSCQITAKIIDVQNKIIGQETNTISIEAMQWTSSLFQFEMPEELGDYRCELSAVVDGKTLWEKTLPFHVKPLVPIQFNLKVDASLAQIENTAFPVDISSSAMGHFGPREMNEKSELSDDVNETDARSGLTYSAQILKSFGAPRLFLANTRPVPVDAKGVGKIHRVAGSNYDGLNDAWVYGFVRPNRAGDIKDLTIKSTSWAKRTYHYEYQTGNWMDFSISAINPAWQVTSNAQKVRVFEDIEKHRIGLPTHLAYESNGQIKIVDAKKGIRGDDMSANWVLAWFHGGKGWDEFDTPYLFVLEKRPELVQCYADTALFFSYPKTAGSIQGMPLYGVALQRPAQTAGWDKSLPADVQARCRYWSQVLVNAPDEVRRTAQVDYANDALTVKDEFTYLNIQDDWKTKGLKIAPVSPILSLAANSGDIDIAFSHPAKDLQVTTLQGPLLAAESAEKMLFRISGTLHYIREVRDVKKSDDPQARKIQAELNQIVQDGMNADLKQHPWKSTFDRQQLMPGLQQRSYVNLLLTLPYLNPTLRSAIEKEIQTETEKYFLYAGIPGPELAPKLKPELRNIPSITVVSNPVTGLDLGVAALTNKFGIDQPFWTSTNLYMVWLYAYSLNRFDWVKQNYPTIKHYFNNVRNSHDWDISASWDTFGGFRVGNGLQEGSGKYAGMVAMARIAKKLDDQTTSDQAAYYATMEMIGMQAQVASTDYLKQRRPWLGSNSHRSDIEYAEKLRKKYYAEFNEFAGISQAVILPRSLLNTTGSYILSPMPESMRLYQEVWPAFTNDFYGPKYDAALDIDRRKDTRTSMDIFVYMITKYPQTDQEVFDIRKNLDLEWWDKLPDYRGYLDSLGKIEYRDLW